MFRRIIYAIAFVAAFPRSGMANEIDGFRLGMTIEQAMKMAGEKGYSFGKAIPGGFPNWTSYSLAQDGPALSFCGSVLTSIIKTSDSNLHEFAHVLEGWTKSLGGPDQTGASQTFAQGNPLSDLRYTWIRENVQPSLSFFQWGTGNPRMSRGYSYVNHPCRAPTR